MSRPGPLDVDAEDQGGYHGASVPSLPSSPVVPRTPLARPTSARLQTAGTRANTTMRRKLLECAAMSEWERVKESVEIGGANVNVQDDATGLGLVHWAAYQGHEDVLQWLISKGAFTRIRDKKGDPPLKHAKGAARKLLLREVYSPVERLFYGHEVLTVDALEEELILLNSEQISEPLWDESGANLALLLVSRHGENGFDAVPLLRWLSDRGIDLEAVDDDMNNLLHSIDWSQGSEMMPPLLEWVLNQAKVVGIDSRNKIGDTPSLLCAACSPSGEDALRCLEYFEKAGANFSLGNKFGKNVPMALARYQGDGPWLQWCFTIGGVEEKMQDAKGRTYRDHLDLFGTEEDSEDDE